MRLGIPIAILSMLAQCACAATTPQGGAQPPLIGTEWRLIGFESPEDAIGTIRPGAGERYTLRLAADGQVTMQLFCNRGAGRWTSPDPSSDMGSLTIGQLAVTRAACPPSRLERTGADMAHVRSFVIRDGRLHLNLKIDSGSYIWEPASGTPPDH